MFAVLLLARILVNQTLYVVVAFVLNGLLFSFQGLLFAGQRLLKQGGYADLFSAVLNENLEIRLVGLSLNGKGVEEGDFV